MAYSFWLSCHTNLLPWWNRSRTGTFSDAEMLHVPFGTSCFSKFFPTRWPWCSLTVCTRKIRLFHYPTLLLLHAAIYWTKQKKSWSHRGVMCLVEMILHRQRPRKWYCIFCGFVRTWCSVLFKHPPAYLQLSRCHGVECPCLSLQWERKNDTDREQKSICDCFPIHPPHPDLGCCNSGSRRKEEGQVQLIRDQWWSVCVLIRDQEQWVGPAPPLPYTNPDVLRPPILAQIRAAGPANRGGPPWLSTVRGWCNSGTDADRPREQKEEGLPGQSRHGPWSLEDGPERTLK